MLLAAAVLAALVPSAAAVEEVDGVLVVDYEDLACIVVQIIFKNI